ncbi:uncharacterized protein TNCV_3313431 [Trichonephila clavipes]|nr:uncharacterized protein TNCV_3313431 [Trichonephila clavipes]
MIEKYGAIENAAIDNMFQCMDFLTAYKTFCEGLIENALPSSLDVSLGQQYLTQILKKSICSLLNEKELKQPQTFAEELWGNREETLIHMFHHMKLSGVNFKEAVKTRSRESGKKLAQKAIDRVQSMVGKAQYKRKHSPECVKSELELFNLPGTQTVIQDGQWKQFHPLSNVFDNAPVEFHISGSAEDYIDLSQTQLYVKAKIVKVDNTPITKDDTIGPVNLFLHSLFCQVDVSLNDRVVSNSSNTYPYRSYIETLLNHGYDSKTSQLTAELFYKDSDDGLTKRNDFLKKVQL